MFTKFKSFLSLSILAATIGACDQAPTEAAETTAGEAGGGKADDANGGCESAVCLESFDGCSDQGIAEIDCLIGYAECLAVDESLPVAECGGFVGALRESCEACEDLPECEEVEDGADFNRCNAAIAGCQWLYLGVMPNNCEPPISAPSCDSVECGDALDECMIQDGNEAYCLGAHAECLAITEGFDVASCDGFSGASNEACLACEDLPECDEIEDGADYNSCQAATASCQWQTLGVMPGGCDAPVIEPLATCTSSAGYTYVEGSCTNSFQCLPDSPDANEDGWAPRADDAACICEDRWDSQGGCP